MTTSAMLVGAHPDDIELAAGGTAAALSDAGHKVVFVDLSDGEPTPYGSHEARMAESKKAADILGVRNRVNCGMENRAIFDSASNRKILAAIIREYRPNVLFVPYSDDAHPDHVQAEAIAVGARFYSKFVKTDLPHEPFHPARIIHYPFWLHAKPRIRPSFVFDVSKYIEKKVQAVQAYESQFKLNKKNAGIEERLRVENAYWGSQIGVSYGEPFIMQEHVRISSVQGLLEV